MTFLFRCYLTLTGQVQPVNCPSNGQLFAKQQTCLPRTVCLLHVFMILVKVLPQNNQRANTFKCELKTYFSAKYDKWQQNKLNGLESSRTSWYITYSVTHLLFKSLEESVSITNLYYKFVHHTTYFCWPWRSRWQHSAANIYG